MQVGSGDPSVRRSLLEAKVELMSRIGKVFLQMGNLQEARRFFNRAEQVREEVIRGTTSGDRRSLFPGKG